MIDKLPVAAYTSGQINQKICRAFAKGCGGQYKPVDKAGKNIATYGIKRGSDKAIKRASTYYYIDHGYFGKGDPHRADGYYRITKDGFIHNGEGSHSWDRFERFNLKMRPWRERGRYIILVPPSFPVGKFLCWPQDKWIKDVKRELKEYTERPIVVSIKKKGQKFKGSQLEQYFKDAWVVITHTSNVQVDALLAGIPVITTSEFRKIGDLSEVENPPQNRDFLKNLAYNQWTLKEIESGQAWRELNED